MEEKNEDLNPENKPPRIKVKKGAKISIITPGFLNFVKEKNIFLDKTLFIKDLFEKSDGYKVILKNYAFFKSS